MSNAIPLLQLNNLAPCSVQILQEFGISTHQELEQVGVVSTRVEIKPLGALQQSKN